MRQKHTNVIVIVADDLGYGDIGAFGNPIVRTPNLDQMAAEGVTLTQHYSASPICAPARAALLTGRYNHRTGAVDVPSNRGLDRISLSETTIADLFRSAGYATGMVGKWHNGAHDMRYHPNARGFDEFAGFLNGGMDYWRWVLDHNGTPWASDGRYLTDVFSQEAVEFVQRHREEPFFLYLAYNAPHAPLQAPEDLVERYRSTGELTIAVSAIYAMIERMDSGIGQLQRALESLDLLDDTLVVFTSDNGPAMGGEGDDCADRYNGPFSGTKYDVLEGGIRVPAIVQWPAGLGSGRRCDALVHFTDWLPTLYGLTGRPLPDGLSLDGEDVLPVLRGEQGSETWARYWQWNRYEPVAHANAAMREGKWKLYWPPIPEASVKDPADNVPYERFMLEAHTLMDIDTTRPMQNVPPPGVPRLFDLETDMAEETDLAGSHSERVGEMRRRWDAWYESVMTDWRRAEGGTGLG